MKRYPTAILTTCLVPWTSGYELDETTFRRQVRLLRTNLTNHLYLFGTAGEGYAVSEKQFDRIVTVFREEMESSLDTAMVGVISLSLPQTLERIRRTIDQGIRNFQISLPSWGELKDAEVDRFFAKVCGGFPDCRFLHYNLRRTKRLLGVDDYRRLSERHPNFVAVKYSSSDRDELAAMMEAAPELQFFFTEFNYAAMRERFECSLLLSIGLVNFQKAREFFHASPDHLRTYHPDLSHILSTLLEALPPEVHMDGGYDKILAKVHDPQFPLRLLPPYSYPPDSSFERFVAALPSSWR